MNWFPLLSLIPFVGCAFWIYRSLEKSRQGKKKPISEKVLRPAGESSRLRTEELHEKFVDKFLMILASVFFLFVIASVPLKNPLFALILFGLPACLWMFFISKQIVKIIGERDNYYLGFRGERVVGESLSTLIAKDYQIFHDLQFDKFNIDHVAVGPGGVFCIETKTRRKPDEKQKYKVIYDGEKLIFPFGTDSFGLDQAKLNAKTLREFLAKSAAETVVVQPVLVLPGWWVDRQGRGPVMVINHKELPQILPNSSTLTPEQIQRIAHQLEQKSFMDF